MNFKKKAHAVYNIIYHIIFVTKYKKPIISDDISMFIKQLSSEICLQHNCELIEIKTNTTHIHLTISMSPQERPSDIIRVLKTQTSKKLHLNPDFDKYIKQLLPNEISLWGPSYFIATTGIITDEIINNYIAAQKTNSHKRKYEKSGKYKKS